MTRKILVTVIAVSYIVLGLWNSYNSLFPVLSSSGWFAIRLFPLFGGALAFYAGLTMFRLNEFGRRLVVILLSIRVAINALYISRLPKDGAWLGLEKRLGEIIYTIKSPYAYQGFLLVWIILALLIIIFLSQRETKEIFAPETTSDVEPDIIFE